MTRVALIWTAESDVPEIVTDDPALDVYSVDERRPNDRVYQMGPGVNRMVPDDFDKLIAGQVFSLGDKPVVEQAVRAMLDRKPTGKPALSIVNPE